MAPPEESQKQGELMGYKGESVMDAGYFMGGHPDGLMYFPPPGSSDMRPGLIPWSELLDGTDDEREPCPTAGRDEEA